MKTFFTKALSAGALCALMASGNVDAQTYTYTLSGSPINTTGWTMGGNASNASTHIRLTNSTTNQNGYIYYTIPQNLNSACDYFSIEFSYRIIPATGIPPADGLAFWYISNPPSGFVLGGGIGLPATMTGFALIFDTYDNNSATPVINANPLITLRQFTGGGYTEGVMTGLIGSELTGQSQITDGNWHTAKIVYQLGVVSVYLDGATTPQISGNMLLSGTVGYFGFSASTGSYYEYHDIKDVIISGGQTPDPVSVTDLTFCQFDPAGPLTASGNLPNAVYHWYDQPTGGTASPTPPTPNTAVPGTYTWYVSQSNTGCPIESPRVPITVTVHPKPVLRISPDTTVFCVGSSVTLNATGAPTINWSPNQNLSSTTGASVVASPNISTVYRAIGTTPYGCADTAYAAVLVLPRDSMDIYVTIDEGEYYEFVNKRLWDPGVYRKNLLNEDGCDSIVILHLDVNYKEKVIVMPNAFSPNGDGRNDQFKPMINYPHLVNIDRLSVYNRWGQVMYDASGQAALAGWDGTLDGKSVDAGIYYYHMKVRIGNEVKEYSGDIHLIR